MVTPCRAIVRPRTVSPFTGEVILLEDVVELLLEEMRDGIFRITGGAGAGKTTAVAHLAAVFDSHSSIRFFDHTDDFEAVLVTAVD